MKPWFSSTKQWNVLCGLEWASSPHAAIYNYFVFLFTSGEKVSRKKRAVLAYREHRCWSRNETLNLLGIWIFGLSLPKLELWMKLGRLSSHLLIGADWLYVLICTIICINIIRLGVEIIRYFPLPTPLLNTLPLSVYHAYLTILFCVWKTKEIKQSVNRLVEGSTPKLYSHESLAKTHNFTFPLTEGSL